MPFSIETISSIYTFNFESIDNQELVKPRLRRQAALLTTMAELGMTGASVPVLFTTHHQCAAIKSAVDDVESKSLGLIITSSREALLSRALTIMLALILVVLYIEYPLVPYSVQSWVLLVLALVGTNAIADDAAKVLVRGWRIGRSRGWL